MNAGVDPTDIIAIVLMALFSMRRMEVNSTDVRAFPGIDPAAFDAWKANALHARRVAIHACFAKFSLNNLWFYGFRSRVIPPVLATVGWVIFLGWIAALMYAWWRSTSARTEGARLGIVVGRRVIEEPAAPAAPIVSEPTARD